jgi:hypothetical protein
MGWHRETYTVLAALILFCVQFLLPSPGIQSVRNNGLRRYATSQKVAGLRPHEVTEFFPIYLILPTTLSPGVYSASDRNEYHKQKHNVSEE